MYHLYPQLFKLTLYSAFNTNRPRDGKAKELNFHQKSDFS